MAASPSAGSTDRRSQVPDGIKFNYLRVGAEFITAFAVLLFVDIHWFGGTRFAGIEPHPYWLVVLLAATVYGTGTGFVIAVIASVIWLTGPHAAFHDGQDYFAYLFDLAIRPLLWISVALLIGEIVSARQRRLADVIDQARALSSQTDVLAERYRDLADLNRSLQVSIATEERSASHILDIAAGLANVTPPALEDTLVAMIATACRQRNFILYLIAGGELTPVIVDLENDDPVPDLRGSALQIAVIREGNIVHVGNSAGRRLLDGIGMLTLPVRHGRSGPGIGLLLFTQLPLTAFTEVGLGEIASLSGWLSEIVGHRLNLLITPPARHQRFFGVPPVQGITA